MARSLSSRRWPDDESFAACRNVCTAMPNSVPCAKREHAGAWVPLPTACRDSGPPKGEMSGILNRVALRCQMTEAAPPRPAIALRCHSDGNGSEPRTEPRNVPPANALSFPNPSAGSVRSSSRVCRRCPKWLKAGSSVVFLAKQPLGSQETPAAIREGFAVQHFAGTGAQLLLVVILWHMLMTPQPTVPIPTPCHLPYRRKKRQTL